MNNIWINGIVLAGDQTGRTIGFPTVNLDPTLMEGHKEGVWACKVQIKDQMFAGALFYGPRLVKQETHFVLEIYIIDFHKEIYGRSISFSLVQYLRGSKNFTSLEELKTQITKDVEDTKVLCQEK